MGYFKTRKRKFLLAFVIVLLAVLLVLRLCVFDVVKVPSNSKCPRAGSTAFIARWSYGYRLPWNAMKRISYKTAKRNDWVAFNPPVSKEGEKMNTSVIYVAKVAAMPGDTLWYNNDSGSISLQYDERNGFTYPLTVPKKGSKTLVTGKNIHFYSTTIIRHEPTKASVVNDSLCVSGKMMPSYTFQQDYYWMVSEDPANTADSRTFGFVPHSAIIGRII